MELLHASSYIYAACNVDVMDSTAKAAGGAKQSVKSFFKVNGRELTAHNRTFSMSANLLAADISLASGNKRRYYKRTPETYSVSYTYLPGPSGMTVDGDQARDYLYDVATLDKNVLIERLPDYTSDQSDFSYKSTLARVVSYSETLIRRDNVNGCYYYDVSIEFEGL